MWGAKRHHLLNLDYLFYTILGYNKKSYFDDQNGLLALYKSFTNLFLEHDDRGKFNGKPFPAHDPMQYGTFVGERITADDKPGVV